MNTLFDHLLYQVGKPLLFQSGFFLFFFLVYLLFSAFINKSTALRNTLLTLFSLYFYYKSSGYFFLLMLAMCIFTFYMSAAISIYRHQRSGKWLLIATVLVLLGALGYYKYTNFFLLQVLPLFGFQATAVDVFLPLGISFFTFELIAYATDVYRGDHVPGKSIMQFFVYVSFFPHLVAGPIVRPHEFFPQLSVIHRPSDLENGKGIFLICLGLIKKCLVSDYISLNYVDRIFENPSLYTGMENLLGMYGYMVQIYCDFSGYTDMALGLALMMGFSLPDNFASPYLSFSLTDFWRRWHITLSSWLRDYLYIPLGGNRKGLFRQYINLMLTMLLGGLWHGASITFVVWGGMHGGMLAIERALNPLLKNIPAFIRKPFGWLITFHFVAACWVFFRAPGFAEAAAVFEGIFASFEPSVLPALLSAYAPVMAMMGLGLLLSLAPVSFVNRSREGFARLPLLLQVGVLTLLIWAVLQVSSSQVQPFIYFRF